MTHPMIDSFERTGCGGLWDHEVDANDPSVARELRIWKLAWSAAIHEATIMWDAPCIPKARVRFIKSLRALEFAPLFDERTRRPVGDDDQDLTAKTVDTALSEVE